MRTTLAYSLQSLRAVQAYLDANSQRLPGVAACGARHRLDVLVSAADSHAAEQSGGDLAARSATRKFHALRDALLRDHMTPIATIAAADPVATPDMSPLRMPPRWATPEALRAHAAGMASAAAPFADVFSAAGLPDDFADRMNAAADAMLAALGERKRCLAARSGATHGLKATLATGRRVVHVLDAMVTSALKGDAALLAEWELAKRVGRVPGVHRTAVATVAPAALLAPVGTASRPAVVRSIGSGVVAVVAALLRLRSTTGGRFPALASGARADGDEPIELTPISRSASP